MGIIFPYMEIRLFETLHRLRLGFGPGLAKIRGYGCTRWHTITCEHNASVFASLPVERSHATRSATIFFWDPPAPQEQGTELFSPPY
jgi:hypothetical protein